ncbi:MAG: hypothetical protein Q7T82_10075 [Armatimonadota bacterium]|nr:hypothetical protein [Armatimonadota bacterium]
MKQWPLWTGYLVIAGIIALVAFNAGKTAQLNAKATVVMALQKAKSDMEYQNTIQKVNANRAKLARLDDYEAKVISLTSAITQKSQESRALNEKISDERRQLASLTQRIMIAAAAPIVIPAGHHPVGTYVRPGRFSMTGSSNFVVYGADDTLKVNTILGDGGVDSYVCDLEEGDTIQTGSRTMLVPLAN